MKTIYNTCVVMKSQEQCDRMKQLCIDNGFKYWNHPLGFEFLDCLNNYFQSNYGSEFGIYDDVENAANKTEITEQEFIELLKISK